VGSRSKNQKKYAVTWVKKAFVNDDLLFDVRNCTNVGPVVAKVYYNEAENQMLSVSVNCTKVPKKTMFKNWRLDVGVKNLNTDVYSSDFFTFEKESTGLCMAKPWNGATPIYKNLQAIYPKHQLYAHVV